MAPVFDRTATAPVYVPIYTTQARDSRTRQPDVSLHLFTDCSLRELCNLLWSESDSWAHTNANALVVSLVYPDKRGESAVKRLGLVRKHGDAAGDSATLSVSGFQPGDSLEIVDATSEKSRQHEQPW